MGEEAILRRSEINRGSMLLPVSAVLKMVEVDFRFLSPLEVRKGFWRVAFFPETVSVAGLRCLVFLSFLDMFLGVKKDCWDEGEAGLPRQDSQDNQIQEGAVKKDIKRQDLICWLVIASGAVGFHSSFSASVRQV